MAPKRSKSKFTKEPINKLTRIQIAWEKCVQAEVPFAKELRKDSRIPTKEEIAYGLALNNLSKEITGNIR